MEKIISGIYTGKVKAGTKIPSVVVMDGIKNEEKEFFVYSKFKSPFAGAYLQGEHVVVPSFGVSYLVNINDLSVLQEDDYNTANPVTAPAAGVSAVIRPATQDEIKQNLSRRAYVPLWWKEQELKKGALNI